MLVLAEFVDVGISEHTAQVCDASRTEKLTPNLIVSNVERSIAFYRDVLGFTVTATVPDAAPYVFAAVQSGPVEVFLNAPEPAVGGVSRRSRIGRLAAR